MQPSSTDVSPTPPGRDFSLENILGENPEDVQHPNSKLNGTQGEVTGWDEESTERPLAEGFCIECEGKPNPSNRRWWLMLIYFQTSPHRSCVKRVQTYTAKYASRLNTGKDRENFIRLGPSY